VRSLLKSLAVLALAFAATACTQIDTGNVGVRKSLGKIDTAELAPGIHWTFATVDEFTTKEVPLPIRDLKPKAADNLTMQDVDVDIYIQPNPANVAETVAKYQGDVARLESGGSIAGWNKISREARESVTSAIAEFPATTMHTKRAEVAARIQEILQGELDKTDKGSWTVTSANVVTLTTDSAIEKSIQANAAMDQEIARANKEKALAIAQAERREEEAKGQAKANYIVSASLTPQLIRLKEIEAQAAFAKQGTHTILMGGTGSASVMVGK
jgi:regulator of protease activity HflC (stomatin/prohibitin superfamily)